MVLDLSVSLRGAWMGSLMALGGIHGFGKGTPVALEVLWGFGEPLSVSQHPWVEVLWCRKHPRREAGQPPG